MIFRKILILVSILFLTQSSLGAISIPTNLSDGDQELFLQYVGFGTSFRPVDNPAPLGLYSGLEIGISLEYIPTGDLGYLGTGPTAINNDLIYPRLTLGKGIFDNVDLFFSFAPYSQATGIGIYSGGVRWGFFQATFVPASFSVLVSGTASNLDNLVLTQSLGVDLTCGINVDPLSFYVGAGTLYGQAQFDPSVTVEGLSTNQVGRSFHTLLGTTLGIGPAFAAFEIDNYYTTIYSFKLGAKL